MIQVVLRTDRKYYHVTRSPTNGSAVYLSRDTDGGQLYCTAIGVSSGHVNLSLSGSSMGYRRFQIGCVFAEYDLFYIVYTGLYSIYRAI